MLSSLNDASHTITRLDLRDDVRSHNGQASSSSTLTNSQHVLSDKNVPDHDNEYPDSEATISGMISISCSNYILKCLKSLNMSYSKF